MNLKFIDMEMVEELLLDEFVCVIYDRYEVESSLDISVEEKYIELKYCFSYVNPTNGDNYSEITVRFNSGICHFYSIENGLEGFAIDELDRFKTELVRFINENILK